MRAQSKKADAKKKREEEQRQDETPTDKTITRVAPFRTSTLVSIAPVRITDDFGTMSRHEGDPVPHEHQFYRCVMRGLFSLDLKSAGSFSYKEKTGYLNLDNNRIKEAQELNLTHNEKEKTYQLPLKDRVERVATVLKGLSVLCGGAKQALHYTDVTPAIIMAMVTKGGNHPLQYVITADSQGLPKVHTEALQEMIKVWKEQIKSKLYVGWVRGFHDAERENLENILKSVNDFDYVIGHPKEILEQLAMDLKDKSSWWE